MARQQRVRSIRVAKKRILCIMKIALAGATTIVMDRSRSLAYLNKALTDALLTRTTLLALVRKTKTAIAATFKLLHLLQAMILALYYQIAVCTRCKIAQMDARREALLAVMRHAKLCTLRVIALLEEANGVNGMGLLAQRRLANYFVTLLVMMQGTVNMCLDPRERLGVWILASQFVERRRLLFSRHVAKKRILLTIKRATNVAILVLASSRSFAYLKEAPMDALLT